MWSALNNFWLSGYMEGWEGVGVVTLTEFHLSKQIIWWAGIVIKMQIAMRFVLLKLPSQFFFFLLHLFSISFFGSSSGHSLEVIFKHFYILCELLSQRPWMGFTEEEAQQLRALMLYDRQSYWWASASPNTCTHSLRSSQGEFPTDPVGIIALPCSRGDKASLQLSSCGALAHAELLPAGKDLKIQC